MDAKWGIESILPMDHIGIDRIIQFDLLARSLYSDTLRPNFQYSGGCVVTLSRILLSHSPRLCFFMRLALGGIFAAAGGAKLLEPRAFARIISAYDLLPEELLVPVAIGIPVIEVLAGVGLLFELRGSLVAIFGLLTCFLFVLGYAIWKKLDVDCGCFSQMEIHARNSLFTALVRDLALMAVSIYLMAWKRFQNSI